MWGAPGRCDKTGLFAAAKAAHDETRNNATTHGQIKTPGAVTSPWQCRAGAVAYSSVNLSGMADQSANSETERSQHFRE